VVEGSNASKEKAPQLTPAQDGTPSRWPTIVAYAGLLAAMGLYLFHTRQFWHYVNDDAYITFRYSRFWASGRGPYFNVGEHVEGYTNFLLMLLLAPVYAIGGENAVPVFAKAFSVICGLASIVGTFALSRCTVPATQTNKWRSAVTAAVTAGLVATSAGYAINSTSGLETILFSATVVTGVLLGQLGAGRKKWLGSGIFFALAALTRPEGVLFFAVYWLALVACHAPSLFAAAISVPKRGLAALREQPVLWKQLIPDALIVTAVFVAHLLYRHKMYDGEWLPNTFYAKAGGFWPTSAAEYIYDGVVKAVLGPVGLWIGTIGWCFASGERLKSLPVLAVAAAGSLLPFVTGTDWMIGGRMVVPFLPLLAVCMTMGWCKLFDLVVSRRWPAAILGILLVVPASWYYQDDQRVKMRNESAYRATGYKIGHLAMAEYLRTNAAKPGDTVALMDIGMVGYYCDSQRILDITGLTDRHIAKSPGKFLDKNYDPAYVFEQKPEFIVIVLHALGNPETPVPLETRLSCWTDIEDKITLHGDFDRYYRSRRMADPQESWLDALASDIGADRVFEHKHPDMYYLLALFRRHG
jgi:hypothetical protein